MSSQKQGTLGEIIFLKEAVKRDLKVSKPFSHHNKYDFIIDDDENLYRVQIKSCRMEGKGNGYRVRICNGNGSYGKKSAYGKNEIDFFGIYLVPVETWFIIPRKATANNKSVYLLPNDKSSKYGKYQENWGFEYF